MMSRNHPPTGNTKALLTCVPATPKNRVVSGSISTSRKGHESLAALRLACFPRPSEPAQTKRRPRTIPPPTRAPHRRFSAVASRKRRRVATPFRLPIRVACSGCSPDHVRGELAPRMRSQSYRACDLTAARQCPRCSRRASNSLSASHADPCYIQRSAGVLPIYC